MNHGSNCAAFFDLDGTLLAPPSLERRFIRYLISRGELGPVNGGRWLAEFLLRIGSDRIEATEGNKKYLKNLTITLADDWAASPAFDSLQFFSEGLSRLTWHAAQGHKIFLLSGSLAPLVRAIAARLPVPSEVITVCATELESCDGRWTGYIRDELISGIEKARSAMSLAKLFGIQLAGSFAYADRFSDAAILGSVGFPVAVNPSRFLRRRAMNRHWPILEWNPRISSTHSAATEFFPHIASIPQSQEKR